MLDVYVPAPDSELLQEVDPGSGIVGSEVEDTGRLRVDFEGNRYDYEAFARYVQRVERAADRHRARQGRGYPTTACAYVNPSEVIRIGGFDPEEGRLVISDRDQLAEWLDVDEVADEELRLPNPTA